MTIRSDEFFNRSAKEAREDASLAPWAMRSSHTQGRQYPEEADDLRTAWERDRDRIVHSTAFRRLMYKTQVFVNWEGDHYRTRLSHSLEVAQVARSLGSALFLNEPLCEALALAHDLGHPPFGHRGEQALNRLTQGHGGFRHNAQVLRVVDQLERRSPEYPGLNLTREVRESLLKHEKDEDWPTEFRPRPERPCLEAQVVDLADSTAYNVHDIEDGLHSGLFSESNIAEVALWQGATEAVRLRHPGFLEVSVDQSLRVKRVANELIKICINDLIKSSSQRLSEVKPL
jgi:dGTPase